MATVTEAVEVFAAATGMPLGTVSKFARSLRETVPPLWPASGKGGGKVATHVREADLVHLLLGFAGAQPSDAPEAVVALRDLPATDRQTVPSGGWRPLGMLPANTALEVHNCTLGERLAALLAQLVALKVADEAAYRRIFLRVDLDPSLRLATIYEARTPGDGFINFETYGAPIQELLERKLEELQRVWAPIPKITRLDQNHLKIAAEILADTLAHHGSQPPLASINAAPAENETPPPCQGAAPATNTTDQPTHCPGQTTLARRQTKGDAGAVQPLRTPPARATAGQSPKKGPASQCPS